MIFALVLLVLLTFSVLWNLLSLIGSLGLGEGARYSRPYGPRIEEAVVSREAHAVDKIAVVPVYGVIIGQGAGEGGFVSADVVKAELRRALEDDDVKAVILKVDSPGGEVLASDEIYRAIAEFQKRKNGKPVVASMGDLAASGGYYVSSPCRWIVAHELTITGSIGVIMHGWNYRGLMDKVGVRPEVYKSGRFKDMLSGEREPDQITPQEREMVQALIDETFGRFKTVVAEGRKWARQKNGSAGAALSSDWANYADGRVLSGTEAYKLGFVDQLGTFEDAVEHAKKVAGIASANVVQYQQRYDLADLFRLFGKTDSKVLKVDLGLDAPKLRAGQLYFLSPTFLH
jgi:protease-4